jgi:hypothetical protein
LEPLFFIAAKKKVTGKQRKQRLYLPASHVPHFSCHREKIANLAPYQIVRQGFFIAAFRVGNPPLSGKLTQRLAIRPNQRRILTDLQQFATPEITL